MCSCVLPIRTLLIKFVGNASTRVMFNGEHVTYNLRVGDPTKLAIRFAPSAANVSPLGNECGMDISEAFSRLWTKPRLQGGLSLTALTKLLADGLEAGIHSFFSPRPVDTIAELVQTLHRRSSREFHQATTLLAGSRPMRLSRLARSLGLAVPHHGYKHDAVYSILDKNILTNLMATPPTCCSSNSFL